MKKIKIFILSFAVALVVTCLPNRAIYAQSGSPRPISVWRYRPTAARTFELVDSQRYAYPNATTTQYSQSLIRSDYGGQWTDYERYFYTYDANGFSAGFTNQYYDGGAGTWRNHIKYTTVNNSAGNPLSTIFQLGDASGNGWVNGRKTIYAYDAGNHLLDEQELEWTNGAWVNKNHYTYAYNMQGSLTRKITELWVSGAWQNNGRTEYTYDAGGVSKTGEYTQRLDVASGNWVTYERSLYTYEPALRKMIVLSERLDTATQTWPDRTRGTNTYDAAGNWIYNINELWIAARNSFENQVEITRTYNNHNQMLSYTQLDWMPAIGKFDIGQRSQKFVYNYEAINPAGIGSTALSGASLSLYPNPAAGALHLSLTWDAAQAFSGTITDMAGRVYQTFSGPSAKAFNTTLPLDNLPSGNYLVSIRGREGNGASQLVTVKH